MSVGRAYTKSELDARAGDTAVTFQKVFGDVLTLKAFLDAQANSDLVALGYTDEEVAVLKTAWADLFELAQIWSGQLALPAPKDFRQFVQQLWGVGSF